jgi:hypothetical protein
VALGGPLGTLGEQTIERAAEPDQGRGTSVVYRYAFDVAGTPSSGVVFCCCTVPGYWL